MRDISMGGPADYDDNTTIAAATHEQDPLVLELCTSTGPPT
jgi:hypothetical protein